MGKKIRSKHDEGERTYTGSTADSESSQPVVKTASAAAAAAPASAADAKERKKVTLPPQPPVTRDGYYFKAKDGKTYGPFTTEKFEW